MSGTRKLPFRLPDGTKAKGTVVKTPEGGYKVVLDDDENSDKKN